MREPPALWSQAYAAVGPSRDAMWDWLEAHYLELRAEVLDHRGHIAARECVESLVSFVEHSSPPVPEQERNNE